MDEPGETTAGDPGGAEETARRRQAAIAGHHGDVAAARRFLADASPRVRATALGALARAGVVSPAEVAAALLDPDAHVRRRASEVAAHVREIDLVPLLGDEDALVVEAAAWALGERHDGGERRPGVVEALATTAASHPDASCREACVAALGALGDPGGLPAILAALKDKPAVRRRAVLALAPFEGPEVDAALERARLDRDRQVRQAAEDLMGAGALADGDGAQ